MSLAVPSLQDAIETMSVPGISIGHRMIADGDELALLPEEMAAFAGSVIKVRRASGAARLVARSLLSSFGKPAQAIPKSTGGMPLWPEGIVGSLAHDSAIAIAAVASERAFLSIGVDIEPAEALDPELLDMVATPAERAIIQYDSCCGRLLFAVKEAVYKAVYPLDRRFLDHHDVEVNIPAGKASVRNSRTVDFRYCSNPRIVVLAFIPTTILPP